MKKYDYAIVIGRFQPINKKDEYKLVEAAKIADNTLVLVGSSYKSPNTNNPFSFYDRSKMIMLAVGADYPFIIRGLTDYTYNDKMWLMEVQETIDDVINAGSIDNPKICLMGFSKDIKTSSYLKMFPRYELIEIPDINFTQQKLNAYFTEDDFSFKSPFQNTISEPVYQYMLKWKKTLAFQHLVLEAKAIDRFQDRWTFAPYEPIFITTSAVIIESGHILLAKREQYPGKGHWALPSGYLNPDEDICTSCIQNVHEEIGLRVPKKVLRGSIKCQKVFDVPNRDTRGRFITHAFFFDLAPCPDPKRKFTQIKGKYCTNQTWIPLNKLDDMSEEFFNDHYEIIFKMIGD